MSGQPAPGAPVLPCALACSTERSNAVRPFASFSPLLRRRGTVSKNAIISGIRQMESRASGIIPQVDVRPSKLGRRGVLHADGPAERIVAVLVTSSQVHPASERAEVTDLREAVLVPL